MSNTALKQFLRISRTGTAFQPAIWNTIKDKDVQPN